MRPYVDQTLVEEIATTFDPDHQLTRPNVLNFRALFKERIASFHLIPCRVCFSFSRVQILFIDDVSPHIAVALCHRHYNQFKSHYYYASQLLYERSEVPNVAEEFAVYPLAEEVVKSLIEFDGFDWRTRKRLQKLANENELPIIINLEFCDFFLNHKIRDTLLKKIRKSTAKISCKPEIERLINESTRVYQIERFFFATPWDSIEWRESRNSIQESGNINESKTG